VCPAWCSTSLTRSSTKLLLTQLCTANAPPVLAQSDRFLTFRDYRGTDDDHWMAGSSIPDAQARSLLL
jgi:hypothetical protein